MSEFLSTIVMVIVMWFGGQLVLSADGGANCTRIYWLYPYLSPKLSHQQNP